MVFHIKFNSDGDIVRGRSTLPVGEHTQDLIQLCKNVKSRGRLSPSLAKLRRELIHALHDYYNYTFEEIGNWLGMSRGTVCHEYHIGYSEWLEKQKQESLERQKCLDNLREERQMSHTNTKRVYHNRTQDLFNSLVVKSCNTPNISGKNNKCSLTGNR